MRDDKMTRLICKRLQAILIAVILVACSPVLIQESADEIIPFTEEIPPISTRGGEPSVVSTNTPDMRFSTPAIGGDATTQQPTPPILASECLNDGLPQQLDSNFGFEGTMVYYDGELNGFYAAGGKPLGFSELPFRNTRVTDWVGFSMDGSWLAYAPVSPTLELLSVEGEPITTSIALGELYELVPEGSSLGGWGNHEWINNELIMLNIAYRRPNQSMMNEQLIMVLDPFRGLWRHDLITELPDFYEYSGAVFSPDLTRVLYVANETPLKLVLWDMINHSRLWADEAYFDQGIFAFEGNRLAMAYAKWSPDSSKIVFAGREDPASELPYAAQRGIYLLDRDGKHLQRLTNFNAELDTFFTYGYRWSSDNRHLAFFSFQTRGPIREHRLYVLDAESGTITFSCPLVPEETEDRARLYWSPDGQFIGYSHNHLSPLVFIDLRTGEIIRLADRAMIFGWSGRPLHSYLGSQ